MQLFDCLCIHNIHNILKYTENENLKPLYFTQYHKRQHYKLIFATLRKESTVSEVRKETGTNKIKSPFAFLPF